MNSGAAAGAAAAAAVIQATKASGVIVKLEPNDWYNIVKRTERPLVVVAQVGVFKKKWAYLTSYKGIAFYTKSEQQLVLDRWAEVVSAAKIWVPE